MDIRPIHIRKIFSYLLHLYNFETTFKIEKHINSTVKSISIVSGNTICNFTYILYGLIVFCNVYE